MDNNVYIDIEKVSKSADILTSLESLINYNDLANNFDEIDDYFKKINFEHANCIYYKDSLDIIYDNLEYIKRRINELAETLRKAKIDFSKVNELTSKEINETIKGASSLSTNIIGTNISNSIENDITVIPPEPSIPQEAEHQIQSQPINTVPIGIAIGATGIAGSIGATIVNGLYGNNEEYELEDYDESLEIVEERRIDENNAPNIKVEEYIEPYKAVRREREADKFYGNQFQDIILDDDKENDNDDEYFKDDFFE